MKRILWFTLLATNAFAAGPLSYGIRAGVPLTDFIDNVNSSNFVATSITHRYIIGPTFELHLPAGFGLEVDALYRRFNYNSTPSLVDVLTNNQTTGNAWEFPILVKYRMAMPLLKPFVDAGVAFDTLSGLKQTVSKLSPILQTITTTTSNPAELKNNTTTGFVIGFGADIHAIVLHIAPEIRYTRWVSPHFNIPGGSALSNQNQAEFLVGFTF